MSQRASFTVDGFKDVLLDHTTFLFGFNLLCRDFTPLLGRYSSYSEESRQKMHLNFYDCAQRSHIFKALFFSMMMVKAEDLTSILLFSLGVKSSLNNPYA
jgi:hypothetical protein